MVGNQVKLPVIMIYSSYTVFGNIRPNTASISRLGKYWLTIIFSMKSLIKRIVYGLLVLSLIFVSGCGRKKKGGDHGPTFTATTTATSTATETIRTCWRKYKFV